MSQKYVKVLTVLLGVASLAQGRRAQDASQLISDPLTQGPEIELVHLYYDEFPTGVAVSSSGRLFSNYPPGLDPNNTNNGQNGKYTIAELFDDNTEQPYPSSKINSPPGGAINYTTTPPTGANYPNYLIGAQSCVIDSQDRLWILDTGRALTPTGTLVFSSQGGPKLVGVSLTNNSVIQTITFPQNVAYPDSYLNDVRLDVKKGFAYITDSSQEGRNGLITVNLHTGESWRHLDGSPRVRPENMWLAYLWGQPLHQIGTAPSFTFGLVGSDGIALSADGETLFFKSLTSRSLYSIPTSNLRANGPTSEVLAQAAIRDHGQTGLSDGMETDTNNFIYHGYFEQNAVAFYNPANGTDNVFVRDPRLNWLDTFSVGTDGYLYFTNNQLGFSAGFYPGTDRRQRPFSLLRAKLPNNGTKVTNMK